MSDEQQRFPLCVCVTMHRTFGCGSQKRKHHLNIKTPPLPQLGKIKKTVLVANLRSIAIKKRSFSIDVSSVRHDTGKEADKGTKVVTVLSNHKKRKGIKRSLSLPAAHGTPLSLSSPSPNHIGEGEALEFAMVRAIERGTSFQRSRSFNVPKRPDVSRSFSVSKRLDLSNDHSRTPEDKLLANYALRWPPRSPGPDMDHTTRPGSPPPPAPGKPKEMEQMKEKFSKLLLGEDMSGGGKGVSSALALSNAITNLAASVFGEQSKLEPMPPERKNRWRREIEWLLSVTNHIVEFVPTQQKGKNGMNMEVMMTRQRCDLLVNIPALRKLDTMLIDCLDNFGGEQEFWYVSNKDAGKDSQTQRNEDKWWIPTPRVPEDGLSEKSRRLLQTQKDSVNQVLKAAMAINAQVLTEMTIPESYIEELPKNGRSSLGEAIYKSITDDYFDPHHFFSSMDLSTEHKVVDLKDKIEASIVIWKRKLHQNETKSSWVSLEKREQFEERAETILLLLKQRFPGLPQSTLDISKIQFNKDVGQAILESYSRILESLAAKVMSRIDDVLYAHNQTQNPSTLQSEFAASRMSDRSIPLVGGSQKTIKFGDHEPEHPRASSAETSAALTLSDFMGWASFKEERKHSRKKSWSANKLDSIPNNAPKRSSYMEMLEALGGLISPTPRQSHH